MFGRYLKDYLRDRYGPWPDAIRIFSKGDLQMWIFKKLFGKYLEEYDCGF